MIGVVNGALEEVLVETGGVMVGFDLARHVVAVDGEGADMLGHFIDGFKGLHQLGALVQHVLPDGHRLPRRH